MSAGSPGVLVVTGGSRGIGAAVAHLAAARGYEVCIGFVTAKDAADRVVQEIRKQQGTAIAVQADVARPEQAERLFESARKLGPISGLVNCAGFAGSRSLLLEMTPQALVEIVAVNLLGTMYCCQAAARLMARSRAGEGGSIVNVSSDAARTGGDRIAAYAAAKGGVSVLTVALARELAGEGVRVNAVSPGIVATEQHAGKDQQKRADLVRGIPMRRLGMPVEVAEAVLWLLSDKASYVTGAVLPVHGGR
jgi:NAD(P)-dependent dehydrogenase (short-subunit alcohol dehydrogenase family)